MSRRRMIDAEHPAYDPGSGSADGRAQCRRCLAELPHPQAMFCSAACLHEFKIRTSPAYARQAVYRRDRGICTHCRLDCGLLDRIIGRLRHDSDPPWEQDATASADPDADQRQIHDGERSALWLIEALGLGRRTRICSLWQVDHRLPFSTGGANCGLGNLRTLCLACHRLQTRDLHRRQKAVRRGALAVPDPAVPCSD